MNLKRLRHDQSTSPSCRASIAATSAPAVAAPSITAATIASAGIAAAVIPGMAVTTEPAVIAAGIAGRAVIA